MGADASDPAPDAQEPSLYNPPADAGEEVEPEEAGDHEVLHLEIPTSLARHLLDVATHLGLTPSTVAARAIGIVCDEIGTVDEASLSTDTLLQQYQARLDLLHVLGADGAEDEEEPGWEAVDEIIQAAERSEEQS
jgi:hypothetical protein